MSKFYLLKNIYLLLSSYLKISLRKKNISLKSLKIISAKKLHKYPREPLYIAPPTPTLQNMSRIKKNPQILN